MLNSNRHCKYEWSAYICWYWSPVGQEHKGPAVEESTLKKTKKNNVSVLVPPWGIFVRYLDIPTAGKQLYLGRSSTLSEGKKSRLDLDRVTSRYHSLCFHLRDI